MANYTCLTCGGAYGVTLVLRGTGRVCVRCSEKFITFLIETILDIDDLSPEGSGALDTEEATRLLLTRHQNRLEEEEAHRESAERRRLYEQLKAEFEGEASS